MFEIVKKESSNKSIRLSNDLIEKLEQLAVQKDTSFNQVVIQCCEYALANMKKPEDEQKK
ncbi:MAG: YlcI/YnfO family protein [Oscillospiraceae bacterium]